MIKFKGKEISIVQKKGQIDVYIGRKKDHTIKGDKIMFVSRTGANNFIFWIDNRFWLIEQKFYGGVWSNTYVPFKEITIYDPDNEFQLFKIINTNNGFTKEPYYPELS